MSEPQTIGRYQIISELGHGAMGAVYRAQDPMMDRTVAIKTILASALTGPLASEYRERFIREAKAAGRLSHPGIVTVYDVSEQDGTPYLVMEFVNGRSLAAAMDAGERFSFDRIFEIGQQVADAIGYAHRNGVIHRDIKPANILLAAPAPGQPERAKIADLGVAKLTASQITTTGQLLGTPAFMPPEQFTGAPIDGRADLFSLGVILYWLATGDKPFAGDTITAVSYKIVHSEPAPPRRINPAVPVALERIILKCLEKDPAARYLTGEALASDLAAAHEGREIMQTPVPPQRTSSGSVMAPVPALGGDPNTTLDSDMRMQMAGSAAHVPPPGASAKSEKKMASPLVLAVGGVVLLLLVGGVITMREIRHRRELRAEAEAQAQAQAQALAQKQAEEQALAQQEAAKAAALPSTPDSPGGQSNQPGQQPSGTTAAVNSAASKSNTTDKSPVAGAAADKKSASKTPASRTQGKQTSPSQQPAGGISNAAPPPTTPAQPVQQPVPSNPATTTTPANPVTKPAAQPNPNSTLPPPVAKPDGPPSADSAKLHIDDGRVPNAVSFAVIMDGKLLFQRKALAEGQAEPKHEDDAIPPGTHEFRVVIVPGGLRVGDSNTVRSDFQAKKKLTLRIDVRENSTGQTLKKSSHVDASSSDFLISIKATGLLGF